MAYTLTIDTGKPNTRPMRRQSSPYYVSSLVADNGHTRVEVELRPNGGSIDITVTRATYGGGSEHRTLQIPMPNIDGSPNMPTMAVLQVGADSASIVGPEHDKLAQHIRVHAASDTPHTRLYRNNQDCDAEALCGAQYHYGRCPSYGRAGTGGKAD